MRVLHIIPSLAASSGGPSVALPAMARALVAEGLGVEVVTTDDDGPGRRLPDAEAGVARALEGGWTLRRFPKQTEFYKVSLPLRRWLRQHARDFDVVHVHAVFSFSSLAAGRAAAACGVPFVVRPLGVLNRWGMENRRKWVKALSFRLLDLPMLRNAAAMHYTSRLELEEAARFGLTNLQRVIPIGMDLTPFDSLPSREVFAARFPETAGTRNVLFLSRIDAKKGLDLLIAAFARIQPRHAQTRLVICGDGDPELVRALQARAAALGIAEHITWAGHVSGELRLAAYAAAEVFTLPSHSENFGIALLEAMAAGLPCVSTDQVALAADAAAENAVRLTRRQPEALANALEALLGSEASRRELAATAQVLARRDYSLSAMGSRLHQLYHEVAPGAPHL